MGDIVGQPGRRILKDFLSKIKNVHGIDVCVANAENAAAGFGLTQPIARDLFSFGVDIITLGNHSFARDDIFRFVESEPRIVRPANVSSSWPGFDCAVCDKGDKGKLLVLNVVGRIGMNPADSPFQAVDRLLESHKKNTDIRMVLVDFHAETTSEKVAMGYYLDGRVSLCLGTHTHVRTADERVLERGTGVITDTGMVGAANSVLGMDVTASLRRLVDQLPAKYETASGPAMINGIVADLDAATGRCREIRRIYYHEDCMGL